LGGDIKSKPQIEPQQWITVRRKFFEQIYDIIAQSVFYSLFFAYPKSRGQTTNNEMKRTLLNIFSKLFTGMKIQSASFDHWHPVSGSNNLLQNPMSGIQKPKFGGIAQREDLMLMDLNE
jgi:hypothetical protein